MKAKWLTLALCTIFLAFIGGLIWLFGPYQPQAMEIHAALRDTIVPQLSVHGVFYAPAVAVTLRRFREVHPELREVPIICQLHPVTSPPPPGWGRTEPAVDLEFHDIPAEAALQAIAMQSGMGYAVRDGGIYLYSITWTDDYVPPLT